MTFRIFLTPLLLLAAIAAAVIVTEIPVRGQNPQPTKPLDLEEISRTIKETYAGMNSLLVEYETTAHALDEPAVVKKHLGVAFLIHDERAFAYTGVKRYYRQVRADTRTPLAPGVDPDYSRMPGGEALQAKMDEQKQKAESLVRKLKQGGSAPSAKVEREPNPFMEVAFDGKVLCRNYRKSAEYLTLSAYTNDKALFAQDYCESIGRTLPNSLAETETREQDRLPDMFRGSGYVVGAQPETVDGAACIVVSVPGRDKLWLDIAMSYALRRRETFDRTTGMLEQRVSNTDFKEMGTGLWLPHRCLLEVCGPPNTPYAGKPLMRYEHQVSKLEINNVPDSLFALQIPAGARVYDQTRLPPDQQNKAQTVSYNMPADAADLESTINAAIGSRRGLASRGRYYVSGAVLLIALGVAVYWRFKRRPAAN